MSIAAGQKGFSLLELAITMAVCVVVIVGIVGSNTLVSKMGQVHYQKITAVQDANQVLELMRERASVGVFPNNINTAFPSGQQVAGFTSLPNEVVTVQYTPVSATLLDVTVTVTWLNEQQQTVSHTLNTLMAQRG